MDNKDLWTELTNYIISQGFTVKEWEQKKLLLYVALRQFFIEQKEAQHD